MQRTKYNSGVVVELATQVLLNGDGQTGDAANTKVCVQRKSDDKYLKWADSTWEAVFAAADHEAAMTERTTGSASGESGYYYKDFTPPTGTDTYVVRYINSTNSLDETEIIEVLDDFNTSQKTSIYDQAYNALDAAIPTTPTTDSVNDKLKKIKFNQGTYS